MTYTAAIFSFFVPAKTASPTKKEPDCESQKKEPCVHIMEDQPAASASGHRYVNVTLQVKNDVRIM